MAKERDKKADRELMMLNIVFPQDPARSIFDLNPGIEKWSYIDSKTGRQELVFTGCLSGTYHQLAHYVILYWWFYSPMRTYKDPTVKQENCIKAAFINTEKLPKKGSASKFGQEDLDFVKGSVGWRVARAFAQFQLHEPYAMINRLFLILRKLDDFYEDVNLHDIEDRDRILKEMREYMKDKPTIMSQAYGLHMHMLTQRYSIGEMEKDFGWHDDETDVIRAADQRSLQLGEENRSVIEEDVDVS